MVKLHFFEEKTSLKKDEIFLVLFIYTVKLLASTRSEVCYASEVRILRVKLILKIRISENTVGVIQHTDRNKCTCRIRRRGA